MEETKYTITTTDRNEAALMINARRMANALYEIREWYRAIYNNRDYEYMVLYRGELYTPSDFEKIEIPEEDRDEHGLFKNGLVKHVYREQDIENKLEYLTDDISDLIATYYE